VKAQLKKAGAVFSYIAAFGILAAAGGMSNAYAAAALAVKTPQHANTPIEHVVVIFDENEAFDHYFGTYPFAANTAGEPPFYAAAGTPTVNGLSGALLVNNPNGVNPQRLDRSQAHTPDFDHGYTAEQKSFDGGLMDRFVQYDGHGNTGVMNYFDGNTVTALWNLAQHFAMNDNYFGTNLGPSTPGAINVVSGNTHGATAYSANEMQNGIKLQPGDKGFPGHVLDGNGTLYSDIDPYYDEASRGATVAMSGKNIGDLLNARGLTWGCFFGGYDDPAVQHKNIAGEKVTDYIPHHEPFQYYGATSNVTHQKPSSVSRIGYTDQANHQYDLQDFWAAADAGNLPNYSFLKAPAYEDGHPSYSDPLDEQRWLVRTINRLEALPTWKSTVIFITYDDSDGWYDHVMPPIVNQSQDPQADALEGNNAGTKAPLDGYQDRLGYGPRLPMIVVSPYAKHNAVINTLADQASVLRFVEDNWNLGRIGNGSFDEEAGSLQNMFDFSPGYDNPPVFLDPDTGEPVLQSVPFTKDGLLYMSVPDLIQSLDAQPHYYGDGVWFLYGGRFVKIPSQGDTVTVDLQAVKLGSRIVRHSGVACLPIAHLAKVLGVQPVRYKANEIVFKPVDAAGAASPFHGKAAAVTAGKAYQDAAAMSFAIGNDGEAGADTLAMSTPAVVNSLAGSGIIVNQTITGARSGKTYNLVITATDEKGNPGGGGGTVYVTFTPGNMDKTGTLTAGGRNIGTAPAAVTLDDNGTAVLVYRVGTAPVNWDAYDNDEITISNSDHISAKSYRNEISVSG
jgi:phospholipase C